MVLLETWAQETSPIRWLTATGIGVISLIIASVIVHRERSNRSASELIVPSKYLSLSSYLCIIFAPFNLFWFCLRYFPGSCYLFPHFLSLNYLQFTAMECYQLSRLYYCFSTKVHSAKGYPHWVFITLLCVLLLFTLLSLVVMNSEIITKCSMRNDGMFVAEGLELLGSVFQIWGFVSSSILYGILEVITVSLYWFKIQSFGAYRDKKNEHIHTRIQLVLHRVLILTYFYLIIGILYVVLIVILATKADAHHAESAEWFGPFVVVSMSYSMFLMQDHNTSEYVAFLRFIKRYKCIWCFFCFGFMINEQYRMLTKNQEEPAVGKKRDTQTWNTRNISANVDYGGNVTGMELSIATPRFDNTPNVIVEEPV